MYVYIHTYIYIYVYIHIYIYNIYIYIYIYIKLITRHLKFRYLSFFRNLLQTDNETESIKKYIHLD